MSTVYIRFSARGSGNRFGGPGDTLRAPALERLLARAAATPCAADWRAAAFRVIAPNVPMPPVASAALRATSGVEPGEWVCIASPLHLVAGMTEVSLGYDGLLDLSQAGAESLAADFNRVFAGSGARLAAGSGAVLFCVFDSALDVATRDPEELLSGDVFSLQPTGRDAPRLRHLMSEVEMWLFEHPVNRQRAAEGSRPVTALWMWGGGTLPQALPPVHGWTAGRDPLFAAFGDVTDPPRDAGSGVVVCAPPPGSAGWLDLERRILEPVLADVRAGLIERVELSSATRCFRVTRGLRTRLWRRPLPWWTAFASSMAGSHDAE